VRANEDMQKPKSRQLICWRQIIIDDNPSQVTRSALIASSQNNHEKRLRERDKKAKAEAKRSRRKQRTQNADGEQPGQSDQEQPIAETELESLA
jgi:hypothetical protein